jgi:hypothetical protein
VATLPLFQVGTEIKQTLDTDDARPNRSPVIVRDKNGRLILVYSKRLKSGRLSDSSITFTVGTFNIDVEAGNGEVNGSPVVWGAATVVASPNTYSMVYVDSSGTVGVTSDFPMSLYQNVVILAFANCGNTSVVEMEVVEKDGYYIFLKRQDLVGGSYVWTDYESRLNSGTIPSSIYDPTTDRLWITYERDGSSYTRLLDLTDPLTFEFIRHYTETTGTLYPDGEFTREAIASVEGEKSALTDTTPELFPFSQPSLSFRMVGGVMTPYVSIPILSGSYLSYIQGMPYVHFYTKSGSVYTIEHTEAADIDDPWMPYPRPWFIWTGSMGIKYSGFQIRHNLYVGEYFTEEENYKVFEVRGTQEKLTTVGDTQNVDAIEITFDNPIAEAGRSQVTKTSEIFQSYYIREDSTAKETFTEAEYSTVTKTVEFDQLFSKKEDSATKTSYTDGSISTVTKTYENPI